MFMNRMLTLIAALAMPFVSGVPTAEGGPGFASNLAVQSAQSTRPLAGPFAVPAKMRGRVDFWKDVFAKYGRHQVVIHHREFPQVVFGVIDLREEAESMSPAELARHREMTERQTVANIKAQLRELADGGEARTLFQQKAVKAMAILPGGVEKYKRVLDEDLVRTQTGIREKFGDAIRRAWRYLPVMEQIFVSEYGLPKELTRLPFIESSFDYTAYSSVGAAGMWQFMPRTARSHGMLVGRFVDERRDPIKATRAAAEYLRSAYRSLGSWPLAITSYNHGVGGVRSKVNKAGSSNIVDLIESYGEAYFGFASRNFYPEFLAANEVFDSHHQYFPEIPEERPLRVVSTRLSSAMSVSYVSKQLDISASELKEANYALLDPVWEGRAKIPAGYLLRVPVEHQSKITRLGLAEPSVHVNTASSSAVYGGLTYKVRKGDTLASIAKKYKTTTAKIMLLNGMKLQMVRVGQLLVIKEKGGGELSEDSTSREVLDPARSREASVVKSVPQSKKEASKKSALKKVSVPTKQRTYVVKKGDTLYSISKKNGCSIAALKKVNRITGNGVGVGEVLVLP
jgi:membrane-bound lytic murein transglycosylase D